VPLDHVLVAVARGGGAQRGQVGPGVGFAEALAPALAAADEAGEEALLYRLAGVRRDPLDEVPEARARRRAGGGELLVEDDVEDRGQVVAAEAGGPGEAEEARVVQRGVPLRLPGPVLVVGRGDRQTRVVLGDPGAQSRPERRFLR
jgi:hypothetical protein